MMECPSCSNQEYPVLCPAVIVGITNGDKIILSKYEGRRFKRYALIAGFAEIGETIEETVHREVMEEVGLKVKISAITKASHGPSAVPCFSDSSVMWTAMIP